MNGDVISVRYGSMWKGRKGGSFPNALMINLWEMGGEQYAKYFASKARKGSLQLCNMRSAEDALKLANKVCETLNSALERARERISIPGIGPSLLWLHDNSIGEQYMQLVRFGLRKDERLGNMRFCSEVALPE